VILCKMQQNQTWLLEEEDDSSRDGTISFGDKSFILSQFNMTGEKHLTTSL